MVRDILFLLGYMGAGKTTTGRLLAKQLKWDFIDLDTLIEERNKKSIPEIFQESGEAAFRKSEQEALYSIIGLKKVIIATGGGCASYADNIKWMNEHGTTIYLKCRPGILFHRIAPEKKQRPMLAGKEDVDIMEFILEHLRQRLPYYVQAHHTVSAEETPEKTAAAISGLFLSKTTSSSPD